MKRKFMILLIMITITALAGCKNTDVEGNLLPPLTLPDNDDLDYDIEDLTEEELYIHMMLLNLEVEDSVTEDFDLEQQLEDVKLDWRSNNAAIEIDDDKALVDQKAIDVDGELIVSASLNESTLTKKYDVVVEAVELSNPADYSSLEVMDFISEMLFYESFYLKEQTGISSGKTLGMPTVQSISNKTYKLKKDVFLETQSITTKAPLSIKANIFHNAYFRNDYVAYNHSSSEINVVDVPKIDNINGYKDVYGVCANSINFTGYIINENTVNNVSYKLENGVHVFYYNLDVEKSSEDVKKQMTIYGGITDLKLSSIEITMKIDNDWKINSVDSKEVYTAKKGVNLSMTQELTTTFTKFDMENPAILLPDFARYQNSLQA